MVTKFKNHLAKTNLAKNTVMHIFGTQPVYARGVPLAVLPAGARQHRRGLQPVSYTHLDVYKRQGPSGRAHTK